MYEVISSPKNVGAGCRNQHSMQCTKALPHTLNLIGLTGVFRNVSPTQLLFKSAEVVAIVFTTHR